MSVCLESKAPLYIVHGGGFDETHYTRPEVAGSIERVANGAWAPRRVSLRSFTEAIWKLGLAYPNQEETTKKPSERSLVSLSDEYIKKIFDFISCHYKGPEEIFRFEIEETPFSGFWIGRHVYIHRIAPSDLKSCGIYTSNKKVYTALEVNVKTGEIRVVADKKMCSVGQSFGERDIHVILNLSEHPHIERIRAFSLYTCPHDELNCRLYQRHFPYCLIDILSDKTKLTRDFQVACLNQMASAIKFIHDQGYVHRDIKPDNILTDRKQFVLIDLDDAVKEKDLGFSYQGSEYYHPPNLKAQRFPQTQVWDSYAFAMTMRSVFRNNKIVYDYLNAVLEDIDSRNIYYSPEYIRNEVLNLLSSQEA